MDLTDTQQECVAQFRSITGIEDRDEDIVRLLTRNNYDLNSLVSHYFDSGFEVLATGAELYDTTDLHRRNAHQSHDGDHRSENDLISHRSEPQFMNLQSQFFEESFLPRLPKAPRINNSWTFEVGIHNSLQDTKTARRSVLGIIWFILLLIPRGLYLILAKLFGGTTDPNRFPAIFDYAKLGTVKFGESPRPQIEEQDEKSVQKGPNDALESETLIESESQVTDIDNEKADQPNMLGFETNDFNRVHETAQLSHQFLLVILSDSSAESTAFAREFLSNRHILEIFGESAEHSGSIVYANNVDCDREAWEVGATYRVRRTPYVMLVANVSNNPSILSSMSIIYKSNLAYMHVTSPEARGSAIRRVAKQLAKLTETYGPQLVSARFEQLEIEFARLIKQQQDDAYQQSLERDRVKKVQKEREMLEKQQEKKKQLTKRAKLDSLVETTWKETLLGGPVRVAIKLPTGKREIASFRNDILVNELYLYVEVLLHEQNKKETEEIETTEEIEILSNEEYFAEYSFAFEVIQPMPKKVIECGNLKISEVGELKLGANLLVEYDE